MPEGVEYEERLLSLLVEKALITENQSKRVRMAMKRGAPLEEALQRTPLVEPVKFATMKALVAHQPEEDEPHSPQAHKPSPLAEKSAPEPPSPSQEPEDRSYELDDEDLEALDIDGEAFTIENHGPVTEHDPDDIAGPVEDDSIAVVEMELDAEEIEPSTELAKEPEDPVKEDELQESETEPEPDPEFEFESELESELEEPEPEPELAKLPSTEDNPSELDDELESDLSELEGLDELDLDSDFEMPESMPPSPPQPEEEELKPQEPVADLSQMPTTAATDFSDLDVDDLDFDLPDELEAGGDDYDIEFDSQAAVETLAIKPPSPPAAPLTDQEKKDKGYNTEIGDVFDDIFEDNEEQAETAPPAGPAMPAMGREDLYTPRGGKVQAFDLYNDEGIPLINEVNQFLRDLLANGYKGFEFFTRTDTATQKYYDKEGSLVEEVETELAENQRVGNRIKVMTRIEPWRRNEAQRGTARLHLQDRVFKMFVYLKTEGEKQEVLTVYLRRDQ